MVRWLGIFLVVALLCGCTENNVPATGPNNSIESTTNQGVLEPSGLYIPQSPVEQDTAGAVRQFAVDASCYGGVMLGEDLVLLQDNAGTGQMTLYRGADLVLVKTISLGKSVLPEASQLQVTEQGIGYYDNVTYSMVFLNTNLLEIGRMQLPKDISGSAWLSADWKMVYYCTDKGIFTLDLQTGISRCLREQEAASQEITGLVGKGEFLRYAVELSGEKKLMLIDAATGTVSKEGAYISDISTWGNRYFLPQQTGPIYQLRFGRGEDHRVLWPLEKEATPIPLLQNDAVLMTTTDENGISLYYYNLQTGLRRAAVTLKGALEISSVIGDGQGTVWIFLKNADGKLTLYHWNPEKSRLNDGGYYIANFFSPENPDVTGLTHWKQNAAELSDRLGANFLLWQDAVALAPEGYTFVGEYLPQVYEKIWPALEKAMSAFPDGFLTKASGKEQLQIALVKEMQGNPQWGDQERPTVLQYWRGHTPVIALALSDRMEQDFYHGVALLMETHILSNTSSYYEWHKVNPSGFKYDNNYTTNLNRTDTTYIQGENRYFIDSFSMSYAKEDRARIFEYACMPGNEEYFESSRIQAKLQRICNGIRKGFDLQKSEEAFLWEQYLK